MKRKNKVELKSDNTFLTTQNNSVKLSAQDTIPFEEIYDNGMILNKTKSGKNGVNQTFSMTFRVANTNYLLLKDSDKMKKQDIYITPLNGLPPDINYQELLVNIPLDTTAIEKTIAPDTLDTDTQYDKDYKKNQEVFIRDIKSKNSDKQIYITLSYETKSKADNPFNILMQTYTKISSKYAELGAKTEILTPEERLELFHNIYNPFNIGAFQLPADMYKRGTNIRDYIAPSVFDFKNSYTVLGAAYSKAFYVRSFSETIDDEFLDELTDNQYRICVSKHLKLIDKAAAEKTVIDRLKALEGDNQTRQKRNAQNNTSYIPYHLKREIAACEEVLDQLQNREELFDVGIYIMISAESKEDLENITKAVTGICQRHHVAIQNAMFRQEDGMTSIVPLAKDELSITTSLLSSGVAMLLPFSYDRLFSAGGFYYGKNTISKSPIIINRKEDKNGNGFFLGKSGSGKSMYAKMEIEDILHQTKDDKVIVIDPEGEFVGQCKAHNGTVIKISPNTKDFINPFDVSDDNNRNEDFVLGKADLILSIFEVFKNAPLTAPERSIIDRCVRVVYKEYINSNYNSKKIPTFVDFDNELLKQPDDVRAIANDLHLYLEMYVTGTVNIFAHHTNVDLSSKFIVFDLRELGANLKKAGMLIILDHIWQALLDNFSQGIYTWLYADEFHLFYSDNEDNNSSGVFFESVFARFRKYGGLATGLTQNITNVLLSKTALSMLQNAQFVVLLEQAAKNLDEISEMYDLSDKQKAKLISPDRGEGILVTHNIAHPFEKIYPKNNLVYSTITTDFKDVIKIKEK
ncbi:MAG: DUF87 domain-containing protein [Oscillospiraceae bacterium]